MEKIYHNYKNHMKNTKHSIQLLKEETPSTKQQHQQDSIHYQQQKH